MGILDDLLARVRAVESGLEGGSLVRDAVVNHGEDILELQRQQLFEGKASSGEDLRPYYSEDIKPRGWFHSVESAGRYAAWKESAISYPYSAQRNPDAPNLYVDGKFHSEIGVEFGADTVGIVPETNYAKTIMTKYGLRSFGLMAQKWSDLFEKRGAFTELMQGLKRILYV